MVNPMEMLKSFKGKSPKEIVLSQMMSGIQNPMIKNLINMAKNGNEKDVEKFARNVCSERGVDFDKELANIIEKMK